MKHLLFILIIAMTFSVGCSTPKEEEPIHTQPVSYVPEPEPVPPAPEPVKSPTPDELPDEGIYAPSIEGKSQETVRNIKAEEFAKEVSDSTVREELKGTERTYLKVEFKYFNDRDILDRITELFERACRDDNYVIDDKVQTNQKGLVYKIWSEKGRVNLERTIKNALEYEGVRINLKKKHYLEVVPE